MYNLNMKKKETPPPWEIIRRIREEHGLTLEEFGHKIGVSFSYVHHLEKPLQRGGKLPSDKVIYKIAHAFGKTPEQVEHIRKTLIASKVAYAIDPEVIRMIKEIEVDTVDSGIGMRTEFLERLKKDIAGYDIEYISTRVKMSPQVLKNIINGYGVLPYPAVEQLARILAQDPDEYLMLAGYMPQRMIKLIESGGYNIIDIFKRMGKLPPDAVNKIVRIINDVLSIWGKEDVKKTDPGNSKKNNQ